MILNTVARHLREGSKSVLRNGWMSVASVSSIVISLFILGAFILLSFNLNHMMSQVDGQISINVYLKVGTTQDQVDLLKTDIGNMSEVSKVTLIPKAEGLKILEKKLGDKGKDLVKGYTPETNPLPDAFSIEVYNPETVPMVAKKIQALNETNKNQPIDIVNYGQGHVEKLFKLTEMVRNFGLILVVGLGFTAMFLIANTIKITIMARQREISIMKMVGATNSFIRWPFFVEGALLGLLGSIITIGILFVAYGQLHSLTTDSYGIQFLDMLPLSEMWPFAFGSLLALGILIGVWGSTISIRKFLKV